MRDAVIVCQFNPLRIDHDKLKFIGCVLKQQAGDDGIHAYGFT